MNVRTNSELPRTVSQQPLTWFILTDTTSPGCDPDFFPIFQNQRAFEWFLLGGELSESEKGKGPIEILIEEVVFSAARGTPSYRRDPLGCRGWGMGGASLCGRRLECVYRGRRKVGRALSTCLWRRLHKKDGLWFLPRGQERFLSAKLAPRGRLSVEGHRIRPLCWD